jgi:hypothetical protein
MGKDELCFRRHYIDATGAHQPFEFCVHGTD